MPTYSASTRDDASLCQDLPEHDVETALLHALGPFGDHANKENVQLNPSIMGAPGSSPTKQRSSPSRPLSAHSLNEVKIPAPMLHGQPACSPQKNAGFYHACQAPTHAHPTPAYWGSFPNAPPYENYGPATFVPPMPIAEPDYSYKDPAKRTVSQALGYTLIEKGNAKKQKLGLEVEDPIELPDPKDMPPVHDDGAKPIHSYAELIGMAILRAPHRRLTLAQIYKWISDHFTFYKSTESGWQNSIRHNLSLNKNFIKQERPKDDPGKGNYWAIKPGEERPYLLGKKNPIRRVLNPDGSQYMQGLPHDYSRPSTAPAIGHFTLAPNPRGKAETSKAADTAKFPDEADFSSDGTIPASDPALLEDDRDDVAAMPPPSNIRSSPPPADIGSSPPPMISAPHKDTPPPVPRFQSSSRSRNGRKKFAGLGDSGYWSSIESSVARGAAHQLTSEADFIRPRMKKGRAEEEIRRIRSSSVDSPSKERNVKIKAASNHFVSSSPVRDDNPLTPAVVFTRPAKPPASVSPNTSLLNHREHVRKLLGTPARLGFSPTVQSTEWSPAFQNADDDATGITPFTSPYKESKTPWKAFDDRGDTDAKDVYTSTTFDVFLDAPDDDVTARGSPEKRSIRRPSMHRAATSSNILANITGSSKSNRLTLAPASNSPFSFSPFVNKPRLRSPAKLGSPLKQSHQAPLAKASPEFNWDDFGVGGGENLQPAKDDPSAALDLFGVNLPSDGSEEAIDIFQDWGRIGHSTQPAGPVADRANGSPVRRTMGPPPARPHMSRASSNRW